MAFTKRPGFARELAGTGYVSSTDAIRVQAENASQFGEFLVAQRTPIIELNSAYGTSTLRDIVTTAGSGAKDDVNGTVTTGEIKLSTGTTASSSALLQSAEVARYIPGYSAEMGMGMRLPSAPTGEQEIRWGGRTTDDNDGFYWIYDASGLGIVVQKSGSETIVRQSSWNVDKLDGTGQSGLTLDPSKGYIYQIDYTWYGYGSVRYSVIATLDGFLQRPLVVHVVSVSSFSDTSINDPSLRIFQEVKNGATTSDYTAYVGGRQYSITGKYVPKYRFTGETRGSVSVGTTVVPLISFRIKSAFQNRSIKLSAFDLSNAGNVPVKIEIRLDGTLTGASFGTPGNYTAADTALESDVSATAISGGSVVFAGEIVGSAKDGAKVLGDLDLDIPESSTVTLCASSFSGSQSCYSGFRLREEW